MKIDIYPCGVCSKCGNDTTDSKVRLSILYQTKKGNEKSKEVYLCFECFKKTIDSFYDDFLARYRELEVDNEELQDNQCDCFKTED